MSPTPEEAATRPQVAPADAPSAPAQADDVPSAAAPGTPPVPEKPEEKDVRSSHTLLYTVFGFLCMGVALWLVFAWTGYKDRYSQQTEGWHLGSTKMIEVTLIRDDKKNLACSSDKSFADVHCGYYANTQPWGPGPAADAHTLQPFNTVKNELFLAAGLWQAPILSVTLPAERFTVVCNYHVIGVLKSVSLRWSVTGNFSPVDQSVAVGTLTDCVIPQ
jgi:hypothetical protein